MRPPRSHHVRVDEEARRRLPEPARAALERTERFAASLIGLPEHAALEAAKAQGFETRIAGREGSVFPVRADLRFSRVNLVIEAGLVARAVAF